MQNIFVGGRVLSGDLNGDGHVDIVVSNYDVGYSDPFQGTISGTGRVSVFNGSINGIVATQRIEADWEFVGGQGHGAGYQLSSADVDGDGKDDLMIGARSANSVLFYGPFVMPTDVNGDPRAADPSDAASTGLCFRILYME